MYLDHAGTTLYAKSLIGNFSEELTSNLLGNPHSASAASQLTTRRIDDIRLRTLRFFNASPDHFDLVFTANATAAIKLVADAFRDHDEGFWYGYHVESHTSLVGVRELASRGSQCFMEEAEVDRIFEDSTWCNEQGNEIRLFAYPGQSNMTGKRLTLDWCAKISSLRNGHRQQVYSLYDAAGLISTTPLDLNDPKAAPDFTALSFYKCFGFPDLGALIVKKSAAHVLEQRKYFGGGTVDVVSTVGGSWYERKSSSIHTHLEDGTIPFHNVIALGLALETHQSIFGDMRNISRHCQFLATKLRHVLLHLRHRNGLPVCQVYGDYTNPVSYGPVIALNITDSQGSYVGVSEVEKLAIVREIQLRTGGLCNPGGIASHLNLSSEEIRQNFKAGKRCGDDRDILYGKPTGVVRVSLGAMSSISDVEAFINFIQEFFVDGAEKHLRERGSNSETSQSSFVVQRLSIFPIKSCTAYDIPSSIPWEVFETGLAWDREWCLVHRGTGAALSQKKHPRMALLKPSIDLEAGLLRISYVSADFNIHKIEIPLNSGDPECESTHLTDEDVRSQTCPLDVCGSLVGLQVYTSHKIEDFFSDFLKTSCTLARLPCALERNERRRRSASSSSSSATSVESESSPESSSSERSRRSTSSSLSNESPILLVSESSVKQLNLDMQRQHDSKVEKLGLKTAPPQVQAASFRPNIVVRELSDSGNPYLEDRWRSISILPSSASITIASIPTQDGQSFLSSLDTKSSIRALPTHIQKIPRPTSRASGSSTSSEPTNNHPTSSPLPNTTTTLDMVGPCQRCQMVCIDQTTGQRSREPFSTLAKTRRRDGKVWFGVYCSLKSEKQHLSKTRRKRKFIRVGDTIRVNE